MVSVGDLQGDPILIISPLGILVLLLAVFTAFGSFSLSLAVFRWSGRAWCARMQAGGVWMSLGMCLNEFQVTGS